MVRYIERVARRLFWVYRFRRFYFEIDSGIEFSIMHSPSLISVVALAATVLGAPSSNVEKRAQTVYLAGDSTMARASGVTTGD
jgi:hypothetical protein